MYGLLVYQLVVTATYTVKSDTPTYIAYVVKTLTSFDGRESTQSSPVLVP